MSVLSEIRRILCENQNVILVDEKEQVNIGGEYRRGKDHIIDMFIAPNKSGTLYDPDSLQKLLNSFDFGYEAFQTNPFLIEDGRMELGSLFFEEKVGKVSITTQITIFDEELSKSSLSGNVKEKTTCRDMYRHIHVRLFPNIEIAQMAIFEGGFMSRITLRELENYKKKK
ncbi:MAG: hypothetical protein IPN70_03685 [Candidatus Moraniibacteriota bacterium]|nr:MAG: hypothetical protein IPN70_03685 [Candidatus Moranbacteria bacterium]